MTYDERFATPEFQRLKLEIQTKVGRVLKVARLSRHLSLSKAAALTEVDTLTLRGLENGTIRQEVCLLWQLTTKYGSGSNDLMHLFNDLMFNKSLRELRTRNRSHVSVVGTEPKPWEKLPSTLNEIRALNYRDQKET